MKYSNLASRSLVAGVLFSVFLGFTNLAMAWDPGAAQELTLVNQALEAEGVGPFLQEFNDMSSVTREILGQLVVSNVRVNVVGKTGVVAVTTNLSGLEGDLLFVADPNQGHFVAFKPTVAFKFSDILGNLGVREFNAALGSIDSIKFDDALLLFSRAGMDFNLNDLGNELAADLELGSFARDGQLGAPAGLSVLGNLDVGGSKFLTMAFAVVGFSEPKVLGRTSIEWSFDDAFSALVGGGSVSVPVISMEIGLPSFKPTFFGQLTLDREFDFTFGTVLGFDPRSNEYSTSVSMTSAVDFPISGDVLATTLGLESGYTISPTGVSSSDSISMSLADADGWDNAFGWGFLTIDAFNIGLNRTSSIEAGSPPDIAIEVVMGGSVRLGSKQVIASGAVAFGPAIVPTLIALEVDDGPNKVGSIGMEDVLTLFEAMTKQKMPDFPGMTLSGLEVGKGPRILLSEDLIDVYGKISILGQDVLVIERGMFDRSSGVDIYGYSNELDLGPVRFPTGEFKVLLTVSPKGIVGPDVKIIASTGSEGLFGASAVSSFELTTDGYRVASAFDLGDLFAMSYEYGISGLPQGATLNELNNIEASFSGSMASDVSAWINSSGKDAVRDAFGGILDQSEKAVRDIENAQAEVDRLVNSVNSKNSLIASQRASKQTCNQTSSGQTCTPWVSGGGCKAKKYGVCYKWDPISRGQSCHGWTVPNYPAQAVCASNNLAKETVILAAQAEIASLQGLQIGASQVLAAAKLAQAPLLRADAIINNILSNLAAPDVFSIQSATVSGSLSTAVATGGGDDSALDAVIVYTVGGNNQKTVQIRFSVMDAAYTAEQMSTLLADAFVTSLESQLGDDPVTQFIVDQAKETLRNLN